MNSLNALDVVLLIVAGFRLWTAGTSGTIRLGHRAALVLGAILGLVLAPLFTPVTAGLDLRLLIALSLLLVGAALLGGLGGHVGHAVGQGRGHLTVQVADRMLGALISSATVLLLCWILLSVVTTFDSVLPNLTRRIATPSHEAN